MSVFALFNPAAGRGRGAQRMEFFLERLRAQLPDLDHAVTTAPGDEGRLVERALEQGHDAIVAVGGDGTWSLVADQLLRRRRTDVRLGLLPAGTGNDFGKSLGITYARVDAVIQGIAAAHTRRIDVGRVGDRHFLNVVGAGFDIAVIDDAVDMPVLRGDALYQFCAVRQLFRFPGLPLSIRADDAAPARIDHLMLVVANANYFGGSFHIAPRARLDDGQLDAVSIANAGAFERARLFSLVGKGRHEGHAKVSIRTARRIRIEATPGLRYEVDGEVLSSASGILEIESIPGALEVFVPLP